MSATFKRKVVIAGYLCTHLFYVIVSISVYTAYFTGQVALYNVQNNKYSENGTLFAIEEVAGYINGAETTSCEADKGAMKNCSLSKKENPSEMKYIVVTLVLLLSFYLSSMVGIAYILCRSTRRWKIAFRAVLMCILTIYICFVIAHVLYVELAGKADGFGWQHLSPTFYVGFANVLLTPFLSLVFILLAHKRGKNVVKIQGLIYAKFDTSKPEKKKKEDGKQDETDLKNISLSMSELPMKGNDSVASCASKIQEMVQQIWRPEMVGFGRDARGLRHSYINITETKPIGNEAAYQSYLKKKMEIENLICKCGCKLTSPSEFPKIKPILTETFVKNNPCLRTRLGKNVNEFYLFHGIPFSHLEPIEKEGLDFEKYRYSTLGKGIYFSEDPVKADQYTGRRRETTSEQCCILVCRVVLGNFVIVKQNHTISTKTQSAPCKSCLKPDPGCCCQKSTKFDSVIYEGVMFREFIVYDTSYCFPEFAILYKRAV